MSQNRVHEEFTYTRLQNVADQIQNENTRKVKANFSVTMNS